MQNRRKNLCVFFKRFYLFIFRQKGREGGKHQHVVASRAPHTGDLASNPGMCPGWGIEPETLWFIGWRSVLWATALLNLFNIASFCLCLGPPLPCYFSSSPPCLQPVLHIVARHTVLKDNRPCRDNKGQQNFWLFQNTPVILRMAGRPPPSGPPLPI